MLKTIGQAIRTIRESRNISQEKLALDVELSKNQIGRIERGANTTVLTLHRIARALDVDADVFLSSGRI